MTNTNRTLSIDALRGLAILGMVLSGSITFAGALPAWMYHAQVPPPAHRFIPTLAGITWVDLVFPFFLFSMGAAIPLSFGNRHLPETWGEYIVSGRVVLKRGLLLAFFAIFTQHIKVFAYSSQEISPQEIRWMPHIIGLVGYGLLFVTFTRFPRTLVKSAQWENILQASGILLSAVLMVSLTYPQHPSFGTSWNPQRSDIILLVLSNVAVVGTALWLVTRTNTMLRLGLLAFFLALRLSLNEPNFIGSWQHLVWFATPATWLFKVYFLQYLCIVLVGTVAGEMMQEMGWKKAKAVHLQEQSEVPESRMITSIKAILCFAFLPVNLLGLFTRELWLNLVVNLCLITFGWWLFRPQKGTITQTLHRKLWNWGVYWLLLGLAFEVFEGGIKKDKSTLSYYFLTNGLAFFLLISLTIITEEIKLWRPFQAILTSIIECGQNPMIAYVTGGMLLLPLLGITGLQGWYNEAFSGAWLGFLRGILFTGVVVVITQWFTKRRIFWRS